MKNVSSVVAFLGLCMVVTSASAEIKVKKQDTIRPGTRASVAIRASETTNVTVPPLPAAFAGDYDADDSTFNRPVTTCTALSGVGTAVRFDIVTIQNTGGTAETVGVFTSDVGDPAACTTLDTFVLLYQNGSFNPSSPLTGCIRGDDDSAAGLCSRLETTVQPGATNFVVLTTFDIPPSPDAVGPYQVNFDVGTTPVDMQSIVIE